MVLLSSGTHNGRVRPVSTPTSRARWMRGGLVGACSAVVTAGAHAAAGGVLPQGGPLIVSALLCATVGAVLAMATLENRRVRLLAIIGALAVAQSLGHVTLTVAGGHHHNGLGTAPSMVAAHIAAVIALGAAIASVEYLYVVCTSVLCWLRLFGSAALRPVARPLPLVLDDPNNVVTQSVLCSSGRGNRAPPCRGLLAA